MPGSYSPPMRLKVDPDKSVKQVLKKYKLDDIMRDVQGWLEREPGSPGALKKHFIESYSNDAIDDQGNAKEDFYYAIDLKDPSTWGDFDAEFPLPPDDFFLALFKAIKADERRNNKRSSYEF